MIQLHPQQDELSSAIDAEHARGARNVLAVAPTGSGKTVVMARKFFDHAGAGISIAHRQELVTQMSLALARNGLPHRVVGASELVRQIVAIHMAELGTSFYNPQARVGVAGVDTLVKRPPDDPWFQQITLWQTDEAHHLLLDNKWGKSTLLFPNARGIGWTATPGRADGYGLGRAEIGGDGVMDAMVMGRDMRWHIENGYLTDYKIWCPTSDIDLSDVTTTASGDYSPPKLRKAVHESHIVGDVVQHYLRIAPGKLGITFAVDVEHAGEIAAAYRAAGVTAEVVTADTPNVARVAVMRRFRRREVMQLVNVDLFGEGTDVPACEVISMARPTASFTLFAQQFGRVLRIMIEEAIMRHWNSYAPRDRLGFIASSAKPVGIIIDHVGNTIRHGLPDRPRAWSLSRRPRRGAYSGDQGPIPIRSCPECTAAYEAIYKACPFCHAVPEPASRTTPAAVDGDLVELDPDVLRAMRGEIDRFDGPPVYPHGAGAGAVHGAHQHYVARTQAQASLRPVLWLWCGWRKTLGDDDSQMERRFYFVFGVDILSAQVLNAKDAGELEARVRAALDLAGVVAA